MKETELYELVGVAPDATPQQIRRAYRKTALRCHPDRGGDTQRFQRLQEAYATLYDAEKRRVYDEFGQAGLDDDGFDLSAMRFEAKVTKEDIQAYCKKYRFSDMEVEDLAGCFDKCAGNVARVLEYIPYSDVSDLKRFVEVFDGLVEEVEEVEVKKAYAKARKVLLKRSKKVDPREEGDYQMEQGVEEDEGEAVGDEEEEEEEDDEDSIDGEEAVEVPEGEEEEEEGEAVLRRKKGRKGKKNKEEDDMADIIELMRNRKAERESDFNDMIERLEEKARKGTWKKGAKRNGGTSSGRVRKT